jgi:hypothetical protein
VTFPAPPGPPPSGFPPISEPPPGFMMPGQAMAPPLPPPPPGTPAADETFPGPGEEIAAGEMDPRWRTDYHGLLYLGALTGRFRYLGHAFTIRTLRSDEELIAAELARRWNDTIGGPRAHSIAMVALCTQLVDGFPLPIPLGEQGGDTAWAEQRFLYCRRWYSMVIDHIFGRFLELEGKVRQVIGELGKEFAPQEPGPDSSSTSGSPSGEGS